MILLYQLLYQYNCNIVVIVYVIPVTCYLLHVIYIPVISNEMKKAYSFCV